MPSTKTTSNENSSDEIVGIHPVIEHPQFRSLINMDGHFHVRLKTGINDKFYSLTAKGALDLAWNELIARKMIDD